MGILVLSVVFVVLLGVAAVLARKQRRIHGRVQLDEFRRAGEDQPRFAPRNAVVRSPSDFGAGL